MRSAMYAGLIALLLALCAALPAAADEAPSAASSGAVVKAPARDKGDRKNTAKEQAAPASEESGAAAEEAQESAPEISVEVVGKREGLLSISPAPGEAVVEVNSQEMKDAGAETVMDAVDLTPSVFIRHQGARYENRLSIRGAAPRLVLLDGIPIAREGYTGLGGGAGGKEAGFAGRILYTMPADIIQRIDVIRSVGAVVYGPAAATGAVINIVTKEPKQGEEVKATTTWGTYDARRDQIQAGVSDGRLAFLVEGGSDYAESHLPLGQKRFQDVFTKLIHNEEDGSKLLIDYFDLKGRRRMDLSQDFSIVPPRYWEIDPWDEKFLNVVYSKALDDETTLDYVAYMRTRRFTTNQYLTQSFGKTQQYWVEGQDDAGADLRYSVRKEDGTITRAGFQWAKITSDMLNTRYYRKTSSGWMPLPHPKVVYVAQERKTKSLFWNRTIPLGPRLRASAGARWDDPSDNAPMATFSTGLECDLSARTTWHLHVGTGEAYPLPTEGDITHGIVPVKARTLSAEMGWAVRPDESSQWQLNLFRTDTKNARILYNSPPGALGPTAFLSKAEDLTQAGVELIYNRQVNENLRWFANYTYLYEDVTNRHEPHIPGPLYPTVAKVPAHIAAAGIRATTGKTRLSLSAKYSADYMAQNRLMKYAWPVDSYLVFDFKMVRKIGVGELSVFVDNLLDTDYETMPAFPRPGRNYRVSYTVPLE